MVTIRSHFSDDKKALLIQVYQSLYGNLSPTDIDTLQKNCEFLWDNGHIISHSKWYLRLYAVVDWFKRKVLWKLENFIEEYLVDKLMNFLKIPRLTQALITMDALYLIQLFLTKYGLTKFLNYVMMFGLFI